MKTVCAWCDKVMRTESLDFHKDNIITHGICDDCAGLMLWPKRPEVMDFLDGLGAPVIVVDASGNACSANKQARTLLQKDLPDIEGLKGGVVFECAFAQLPEGCGNTIHCDGCTIRNTVMDTFMSGNSHLKTPAGLTRGTTDNHIELQFLISTEKVKDVVLLRIDKICST